MKRKLVPFFKIGTVFEETIMTHNDTYRYIILVVVKHLDLKHENEKKKWFGHVHAWGPHIVRKI